MFRAREDQRSLDIMICQQVLQQKVFVFFLREVNRLIDRINGGRNRGYLDPHRVR